MTELTSKQKEKLDKVSEITKTNQKNISFRNFLTSSCIKRESVLPFILKNLFLKGSFIFSPS